jgi:hypothetical protein
MQPNIYLARRNIMEKLGYPPNLILNGHLIHKNIVMAPDVKSRLPPNLPVY